MKSILKEKIKNNFRGKQFSGKTFITIGKLCHRNFGPIWIRIWIHNTVLVDQIKMLASARAPLGLYLHALSCSAYFFKLNVGHC